MTGAAKEWLDQWGALPPCFCVRDVGKGVRGEGEFARELTVDSLQLTVRVGA